MFISTVVLGRRCSEVPHSSQVDDDGGFRTRGTGHLALTTCVFIIVMFGDLSRLVLGGPIHFKTTEASWENTIEFR